MIVGFFDYLIPLKFSFRDAHPFVFLFLLVLLL